MTIEELLNSIIQREWKPFGRNYGVVDFLGTLVLVDLNDGRISSKNALNLRRLTSKESGLWQFVCENGMVKMKEGYYWQNIALIHSEEYDYCDYQYWLIESALKDESELEDFLLQNIKVDVESK